MLYLRYVFIFVLRNNYTGQDYHPGPVHRSPPRGHHHRHHSRRRRHRWSMVLGRRLWHFDSIRYNRYTFLPPPPPISPTTRAGYTMCRTGPVIVSRACATKYSAGPSRRWMMMMMMTMIIPRWWYTRRKTVWYDIAAYRTVFVRYTLVLLGTQ